ncbi:MAG: phosphoribosylformylglycinamidine synthase subunit PurQ [Ignavibacteriales bacterium]|nr:phosphoribosylformylglycinamidine synthase subunit PurQ [Ignavibacteriales bacterium]
MNHSSRLKFGIVVFPGSNCDHDAHYATGKILQQDARFIWHKEGSLGDVDVVILPGGFSYGDYLRCGAIARFSPIMKDVVRFAKAGGAVLGICNGFQILTEAGLLPGVLLRNASLQFVCKYVCVRVENAETRFTSKCRNGEVLEIPIAHGDGNYFIESDELKRLEDNRQIVFRYCDGEGKISKASNPNGAMSNIAGVVNTTGNVLGMMPHPERASDPALGHTDGRKILDSVVESLVLQTVLT